MDTMRHIGDWLVAMDSGRIIVLLLIGGSAMFVLLSHLPWRRRPTEQP